MLNHVTPVAWSYIVLLGGIAIILLAFGFALRARNKSRAQSPRLADLEQRFLNGEISKDEYERQRAEILVEEYEKHRAA